VKPDGRLFTYDKKHLFRFAGEEKVYSAGIENITVELKGWKIRPFICYDLRFPAWTRNINNQYDIALFIANWPEKRSMHWKSLLQARAIENQCYVIGVNRVGNDGNDLFYSGDSSVIDPLGKIIFQKHEEECTYTTALSFNTLENYRKAFPAWMDSDIDMINFP
jgi:predicted amidohydrolase